MRYYISPSKIENKTTQSFSLLITSISVMPSSKVSMPLYVLCIALLLQIASGANPLVHLCSTNNTFTPNNPYQRNLNNLLRKLALQTPPTGFGFGSVGQTNQAFGLSMCRGDTNITECSECISRATIDLRQLCPNDKEGYIWYDTCYMKYSDAEFFGTIDANHSFILRNVIESNETFFQAATTFLGQLSQEAFLAPKLFAAGETKFGNSSASGNLFGLVECTRDLSSVSCKNCIDATISILPNDTVANGGRIIGGSCSIRYEIFPFFNV